MGNEKILLIDPEKSIRGVMMNILKNYSLHAVDSSEAALLKLNEEPFDLVLINLPMERMHSLFLKIRESFKDLACLLLIHSQDLEKAVDFLKTGIFGFILKPFTQLEILTTVEDSLWKVRLLNENVRLKLLLPLYEMTQNLSVRPKLNDLFQQIVKLVTRETSADLISFSFKNGFQESIFEAFQTTPAGSQPSLPAFIKWIENKYASLRTPLMINDLEQEAAEAAAQFKSIHYSSVMIFPLASKSHLMGFLISGKIRRKKPFVDRDKELFTIIGNQLAMTLENFGLLEDLENAHFESLKALASAIEAKDSYTSGHCDRLVEYSILIAEKMNLTMEERKQLRYGAALHDIGKIGIRESILGKTGKLTPVEYEEMKKHPKIGAEILQKINFLRPVAPIIYHHQECFDGSGYPEGISGDQIPVSSRIVAILDTFDAMTTDRPYRKALPVQQALDELRQYAGKQFDPHIVKIFVELIQEKF